MNPLRQASILLVGGLFVSLLAPSCTVGDDDSAECKRGNKGCDCKSDDSCNSGLVCNGDGKCESAPAGLGGTSGAGGGGAGRAAGGRAGSESFSRAGSGHPMGGTSQAGTAGEGTGGTLGRGTGGAAGSETGGIGNATGQAGESAAGEAGGPSSGGTGGSGNGGSGNYGGTGGTGTGGSAGMGGSPPCTKITTTELSASTSTAGQGQIANFESIFEPNQGDLDQDDAVSLQFYDGYLYERNFHGADVGTFELGTGDDGNYASCSRCVVAQTDGATWFFATEGTLTVESDSKQMMGYPKGTLRDVVLREATFDSNTFESTLVPGGACLTLSDGDLLVNRNPPAAGWTCVYDYYDDGSFCDCGCGVADPDCSDSQLATCEYCYCNPDDDMDCTTLDPAQPWLCSN